MDRRTERTTQAPPAAQAPPIGQAPPAEQSPPAAQAPPAEQSPAAARPPVAGAAPTTGHRGSPEQPTTPVPTTDGPGGTGHQGARAERREVLHQQQERFGGIRWGSAFFGWLTTVGTAVLLGGIAAAVGAGFGLAAPGGRAELTQSPGATTAGVVVGAVVVALALFVAYYCGGYVAGRMARFNGAKQGMAVWVWAVVIAVVVGVVVAVGGARLDLAPIGVPVDPAALGTAGIIAAVVALAVALVGAVLGGLAGMRFHRRIDRATAADHTEPVPPIAA